LTKFLRYKPYSNSLTGTWTTGNGDRYYSDPHRGLFLVTDGGSDPFAGEASLDILCDYASEQLSGTELPSKGQLHQIFDDVNQRILEMEQASCFAAPPAISATLAIVRAGRYVIAHVGSSRAYLSRNSMLMQITREHSTSSKRKNTDSATIDPNEGHSLVLTRWLGRDGDALPDVHEGELFPGDCLLLCTDGLPLALTDDELLQAIEGGKEPARICRTIFETAFARNDRDSITVVVIVAEGETVKQPDGSKNAKNRTSLSFIAAEAIASWKEQPPAVVEEPEQPPAAAEEQEQPPAVVEEPEQPPAAAEEQEQPPAAVEEQEQPPAVVEEPEQPPAALEDQEQPPAVVVEPEQPPAAVFEPPLPPVVEPEQTPTDVEEPEQPPSVVVEQEQPPLAAVPAVAVVRKKKVRPKREEIWGPPIPKSLAEPKPPEDSFIDTNLFLGISLVIAIITVISLFFWH